MTGFERSLVAFDPTLQPIGYELATELLATPDERAHTVVVRLTLAEADPASPVDWFGTHDEAATEIRQAS